MACTIPCEFKLPAPSRTKKVAPVYLPLVLALCLTAFASASCSKATAPTKDELLARANDEFAAQHYDKAEKDYRELLGLAPDDRVAPRQLAVIYYNQGQLPQAYEMLKKATETNWDDIELQRDLAVVSATMGDLRQTKDAALLVLEKQPGDEQALILLARAAITPDLVVKTRNLIESLRDNDQDRAGYHLALGYLAVRQQDLGQAHSEFETARKLDPKSALAHTALANLAWARYDLKAADEAFKTAADLSPLRSSTRLQYAEFKLPSIPDVKFHLGMAHYMLGQEEPARAALQGAVDSRADFPAKEEARSRLGLLAIDPRTADARAPGRPCGSCAVRRIARARR